MDVGWARAGWARARSASGGGGTTAMGARRATWSWFSTRVGLYGLDGLHTPSDFERLARETIETCTTMAGALKAAPARAASVGALDEISDAVCTVVDVAEVCRHTHPNREFVHAAERAYVQLQDYVAALNSDDGLYAALRAARRADEAHMSSECRRVALTLQQDFERGGIHLQGRARATFDDALSKSLEFGMEFQRNLVRPEHVNAVELDDDAHRSLPRKLQAYFERSSTSSTTWRGALDAASASTVLRSAQNSDVRRKVFVASNAGPEPNKNVLANLLSARTDVARSLGFQTYANFAMSPLLARTPEAVRAFLLDFSDNLRARAADELALIQKYAANRQGDGIISTWDKTYFMAQARGHECEFDSRAISEYFPLEGVIMGIGELLERVLGLQIQMQDLARGEGWTEELKKLVVKTRDGEMRGTIYLDLLPRPGKFNHAAHFVIRCSRKLSPTKRQHPSVALVCNFGANSRTGRALLTHAEVETLLHEFGHAMHSVLSDTEYQHLSGTRAPMDIVEVPSHLFEHFAWDPDALKLLGRHYLTDEPLPNSMITALRKSKSIFDAIDSQQQLVFAMTDLELHSQSSTLSPASIGDLAASIQNEHSLFPVVPGTNWELRFGHFVGYGSTYYSYLYADVLAQDIWKRFFAGDSLAPGAGESLRDKLLRHGGSRDPEKLVREVLGNDALYEIGGGYRPRV